MRKNRKSGYFVCLGLLFTIASFSATLAAQDLMEVMFQPARDHEKIVDLGQTKEAVGNEVFKESTDIWLQAGGCLVNNQRLTKKELTSKKNDASYAGSDEEYCKIIGGSFENKMQATSTSTAPLIVRITKFLLRMTMVLAVTMIIYNGVLRIVESAKWAEVKDAKTNILYIIGGIVLALASLGIINLISSISISSLNTTTTNEQGQAAIKEAVQNTANAIKK